MEGKRPGKTHAWADGNESEALVRVCEHVLDRQHVKRRFGNLVCQHGEGAEVRGYADGAERRGGVCEGSVPRAGNKTREKTKRKEMDVHVEGYFCSPFP